MALRGTLRSFPPTEILQFLTHSRKSGTLRVHDETDTKLLSFADGKLVYAVHQRVFPRLRDVLIHRGLAEAGEIPTDLNAHRWDEAMSRALARRRQLGKRLPENRRIEKLHSRSEDARLGHILVAQGRLSESELELATMPHNIPDALLESILIASELLAAADVQTITKNSSEPLLDRILATETLAREDLELAIARMSEESLAELLVFHGHLGRSEARQYLTQLKSLRERTAPMVRLGEYLVAIGKVSQRQMERALEEQFVRDDKLGEILIERDLLTPDDLDLALDDIEAIRVDFGPLCPFRLLLADRHGIGYEEMEVALTAHAESGLPLADQFIATGRVTEAEMRLVISDILTAELCDLLLWADASFEFLEGFSLDDAISNRDFPTVQRGKFDIQSLLLESHRILDELLRTSFAEIRLTTVFVATKQANDFLGEDVDPFDDRHVVQRLDGRRSVKEACAVLPGNALTHLRLFAELYDQDVIRKLSRQEAFGVGQQALTEQRGPEALTLFQHALDTDGETPPNPVLLNAIQDARWACETRLLRRAIMRAKKILRHVVDSRFGRRLRERLERSERFARFKKQAGEKLARCRAATTKAAGAVWRFVTKGKLAVEEFLIRTGWARRLWTVKAKLLWPWERFAETHGVRRARGVLYASVGSVVLLALLLQGVPKPGSVDYPEVEDPLSYRASLPFFEAKGPIEVAPAFHDGRIYFAGRDGVLRALRRAEQVPNKKKEAGKFELAWKLEVGQFGDILSSPIVARDALFLSNVRGSVYSVSLEGEILWNKDIGRLEPIRPCALYGSAAELVGLAVVTREAVVVLSPDDGRQLYRLETGNRIIAEPVGDGELLFVGSGDNKVYCASWRSGEINWEFEDSDDIIALQRSSGLLVYATHGGRVVALDEVTGLERWRKAYARGSIRSAGRVGLDRVYVELDRGVVEVIDVRKGQALSTCKPNASLDVAMARPYGHRYFFASGAGHLGELDETGKMRWRSDIPLGGITGWVTGVDHIAVSNRQGNLVLFSLGPENVHRVSMNEDDG